MTTQTPFVLLDPALLKPAIAVSFAKLSPRVQWRNTVIFVVYVGSILTTLLGLQALQALGEAPAGFIFAVALWLWLWFTVLFANFAEALVEGRSNAQAASLRSLKKSTWAKKLHEPKHGEGFADGPALRETAPARGSLARAAASVGVNKSGLPEQAESLCKGDILLVEAGDMVPLDGEVIEVVDSAIRAAQPALGCKAVHTGIPADLPLVEFDAVLMERLLVNLLENAVKYGAPPFELRARATPNSLPLTVRDHGPGLPPALRGREAELFEKFTRGQPESAPSGVGLGLAIRKAIAGAHGGQIAASKAPDGGGTV